jgi:hypothetical protein
VLLLAKVDRALRGLHDVQKIGSNIRYGNAIPNISEPERPIGVT